MQTTNKTIAKNSLYLYLRTFISVIVTLYTSRVFLELLGFEDFGIYNIVGGVIALFSVLRNLLAGSIQRFLNIEIGQNNKIQENKYLDICIVINIVIIILFLLFAETIGLWIVSTKLNIPPGKETVTIYVYHLSTLTAAVSILAVPYTAYIISHERMEFYAWITIIEIASKMIITLLLSLFISRLIAFCWMYLATTVAITLLYYLYCKYRIGMFPFKLYTPYKNNEYRQIFSFSFWTIMGHGAIVFRDQGISFIFNIYKGVFLNAAMGIVTQVSNVFTSLFSNVQTAFMPQIVQSSASDPIRFKKLLLICVLASFLLMSFVCLPMIANAEFVLHLWLGENIPDYTTLFVQVFMIKILIVSLSQAVYQALVAVGKIKENQIWMILISITTVASGYITLLFSTNPVIVIIFVVIMDFLMLIIQLYYISYYTNIKIQDVITVLYKQFLIVFFILIPFSFWVSNSYKENFLTFFTSSTILTMANIIVCYFSFDDTIRKMVLSYIRRYIH